MFVSQLYVRYRSICLMVTLASLPLVGYAVTVDSLESGTEDTALPDFDESGISPLTEREFPIFPGPVLSASDLAELTAAVDARDLDLAKERLASLRELHPANATLWEVDGTIKLIENDPAGAIEAFERALALMPNESSSIVQAKYGSALLAQGKLDAAEVQLSQAIQSDPANGFALRYLARIAESRGKLNEAVGHYKQWVGLTPSQFSPAHQAFADFLIRTGKPEAVKHILASVSTTDAPTALFVTTLRAAVAERDAATVRSALAVWKERGADATDVTYYTALADRFEGSIEPAAEALRKLFGDSPDNPVFGYQLAVTLIEKGDSAAGVEVARELAPKLSANHPLRLDLVDLLLRDGHSEVAAEVLAPAHKETRTLETLLLSARIALRSGDLGEARDQLSIATDRYPDRVDAWTERVGALIAERDLTQALRVNEEALRTHPSASVLLFQSASINEQLGTPDKAESIYLSLLSDNSTKLGSLNNLANLLASDPTRSKEALSYAEQAFEIAPQMAVVEDTLGWILHLNGRNAEAVEHLSAARAKSQDNVEIVCHLGIVLAAVADESAAATLERCLQLEPEGRLAELARANIELD